MNTTKWSLFISKIRKKKDLGFGIIWKYRKIFFPIKNLSAQKYKKFGAKVFSLYGCVLFGL
jgi:hypothetical protein